MERTAELRVALTVPDFEAAAERVAPRVMPPWGGRNLRLRAPDVLQLTLFDPHAERTTM